LTLFGETPSRDGTGGVMFDVDDNDKWHFNLLKEQFKFQKS
jgi:hypothetical protein